jgi:hypothetical protein
VLLDQTIASVSEQCRQKAWRLRGIHHFGVLLNSKTARHNAPATVAVILPEATELLAEAKGAIRHKTKVAQRARSTSLAVTEH